MSVIAFLFQLIDQNEGNASLGGLVITIAYDATVGPIVTIGEGAGKMAAAVYLKDLDLAEEARNQSVIPLLGYIAPGAAGVLGKHLLRGAKFLQNLRRASASGGKAGRFGRTRGTHGGTRAGKPFTRKGKREVRKANRAKNDGRIKCENCGVRTVRSKQSTTGVTTPRNAAQVDHVYPKSRGGDGSPGNGEILCRKCNGAKSDTIQRR